MSLTLQIKILFFVRASRCKLDLTKSNPIPTQSNTIFIFILKITCRLAGSQ